MSRPVAYDPAPAAVECIQTHASFVFLAGAFAYKIKRAVKYPFLDFSTLEKRHKSCLNELRLNRRTAPGLYLEVVPITIDAGGDHKLRGAGEPVEWVLVMRRFDQDGLFDRMAAEGRLPLPAMSPLAAEIAALHGMADRTLTMKQAIDSLETIISEHEALLHAAPQIFKQDAASSVIERTRAAFDECAPLLRQRASGGSVRHCHGDLHLRNIVEIGGKPVLFDALEFDNALATIDVLYDLAFLLMDLGRCGLPAHANAVLNTYLEAGGTDNLFGLAALPLFLSVRAMIRAKVELLRAEQASLADADDALSVARVYFELAARYLTPDEPRLIAIGGLSGSGKSTIARAIAAQIGAFPGAVIVRSDVERKRLFGIAPEERLPDAAYAPGVSDQVYTLCRKRAACVLEADRPVIVDAVHATPEERDAIARLAGEYGAPFDGFWLDVPGEIMAARVARRVNDVSDATPAVVQEQLAYDIGPMAFDRVDASGPIAEIAEHCMSQLRTAR